MGEECFCQSLLLGESTSLLLYKGACMSTQEGASCYLLQLAAASISSLYVIVTKGYLLQRHATGSSDGGV